MWCIVVERVALSLMEAVSILAGGGFSEAHRGKEKERGKKEGREKKGGKEEKI